MAPRKTKSNAKKSTKKSAKKGVVKKSVKSSRVTAASASRYPSMHSTRTVVNSETMEIDQESGQGIARLKNPKATLQNIIHDVKLIILSNCDIVTATLLHVTCKDWYKAFRPKGLFRVEGQDKDIRLAALETFIPRSAGGPFSLKALLESWILNARADWKYSSLSKRFVTEKTFTEEEAAAHKKLASIEAHKRVVAKAREQAANERNNDISRARGTAPSGFIRVGRISDFA